MIPVTLPWLTQHLFLNVHMRVSHIFIVTWNINSNNCLCIFWDRRLIHEIQGFIEILLYFYFKNLIILSLIICWLKVHIFYLPKNVCQSQIYFLKFDLRHINEIRDFHNTSILFYSSYLLAMLH